MPRFATANDVINRAAIEIGIPEDPNPVTSTDENFVQLRGLLNSAGQEMVQLHNWQGLTGRFEFTTVDTDTGIYELPDDFSHMIDQTGWDRTNRVAMGGPLSSQDWAYLEGRDLVSQSIYASFRLDQNKLELYPQPPPEGLQISFEYMTRNWLAEQGNTNNRHDVIATGTDVVLYEPILIVKFLKCKILEAKGFDASSARMEFENMFDARTGKDEGASILSASRSGRTFPYLNGYSSVGDTGFGGLP